MSFRSTSKFVLREEDDPEDPEEEIRQKMPPAGVMVRLILIMVARKLLRNPNTYSSVLGLVWSLISFKYVTFWKQRKVRFRCFFHRC